jgi:hypothetical protein
MLSCWLLCTVMGLVWMYIVMGLVWIYGVMGLVWIYGAKNTVIMQGRDSVAENRYNDSIHISIFFKFSVRRNQPKVNILYRYVTLHKSLQRFNTLTENILSSLWAEIS